MIQLVRNQYYTFMINYDIALFLKHRISLILFSSSKQTCALCGDKSQKGSIVKIAQSIAVRWNNGKTLKTVNNEQYKAVWKKLNSSSV